MALRLTRITDANNVNTTWVKAEADGPSSFDLTQDETTEVAKALITSWQLAMGDKAKRHLIERILLRMDLELTDLDVLQS